LIKEPMTDHRIDLPKNFRDLPLNNDILDLLLHRESHRVFSDGPMSLLTLAFLLWATQGIKSIRGKKYATLRTVPSAGARHPFETYLVVRNVEGLNPGAYHYLPMTNQMEFLGNIPEVEAQVGEALMDQRWALLANAVLFWSVIPYRTEWRYSSHAHRVIPVDAGHVCQNLYIACEAMGLGTCAIGAFDRKRCDALFHLDGEEEFILLASPVGTVSPEDRSKELDFYAFLKDQES